MQHELPDILASRLNFDVIAFRGNTRKEMIVISVFSLTFCIVLLGTLAKLLFGLFLVGVGLSFPASVPLGWIMATLFQKLKDGKPKGHLKQRFLLWLEDEGIKSSPFVRHTGKWCIKRWI